MKFNFPNKDERVLVNVKFTTKMFKQISDIAEREECLRADTILVLLEGAIGEYYRQGNQPQDTAYPLPPSKENSPDEKKPTTLEEAKQYPEWSALYPACINCQTTERKHIGGGLCSKCYYQEKKKEILPKKEPIIIVGTPDEEDEETNTPEEVQAKPKYQMSPHAKKMSDSRIKEDQHMRDSIGICDNPTCSTGGKFIKGLERQYKGKNLCSDRCVDEYLVN